MKMNSQLYPRTFSAKEVAAVFANIKAKWHALKGVVPSKGRYLHLSALARMVEVTDPETGVVKRTPWVQKPGVTYRKAVQA